MTYSIEGIRPKRLLLALATSTILFLSAMSMTLAASAEADWACSRSGAKPWEHFDHWFLYVDDAEHRYVSGHTHSNGEHHHIWDKYTNYGFTYAGQTHDNCGV